MIAYEIIITRKADADEQSVYTYISETFGEIYAVKFREKIITVFQTLSNYPFIGRVAKNDKSLKVLIINKQNKLIYKVTEKNIVIIRLLNTKRNDSFKY